MHVAKYEERFLPAQADRSLGNEWGKSRSAPLGMTGVRGGAQRGHLHVGD